MKAKTTLAICLLTFAPAGMWLVACSGGDSNTGTDGGGGMDATVDDTGTGMDTGTMDTGAMDTGMGNDGGGGNCGMLDGGACRACCRNQHMAGYNTLIAAEHSCICSGNKCPTCAGNYCDGGQGSQSCNTCGALTLLPDGGSCYGPVVNACSQSVDCTAYRQCLGGCP